MTITTTMKVYEIIKIVNSGLPLDTKMAVRLKLNDRKWSDVSTILRREKVRLLDEVDSIERTIKFLKGLEE